MKTYRIIYRDGTWFDSTDPPKRSAWDLPKIWAVIDLEILEGGDAYQALLSALEVEA